MTRPIVVFPVKKRNRNAENEYHAQEVASIASRCWRRMDSRPAIASLRVGRIDTPSCAKMPCSERNSEARSQFTAWTRSPSRARPSSWP